MSDFHAAREDWGKLVLRVAIGGLMLFHGIAKLQGGVDMIAGMLTAKGLPEELVYGVYVGEVVAPLLILAGLYVRLAGLVLMINMIVAIYLAHAAEVLTLSPHGGWAIEQPMLFLLGGLSLALIGGGRFALLKRGGGA